MWDTIQKLQYRAKAGIPEAKADLDQRLTDRVELPLRGIHGEKLFLTGVDKLQKRAAELNLLYEKLPVSRGVSDTILLDAWSSATIEGARTTVDHVRKCFDHPLTKDDAMVVNSVKASNYAYNHAITQKNIRKLWEIVTDGVCENEGCKGTLYRDGMVYIGNGSSVIHTPASAETLPSMMEDLFTFREEGTADLLLRSFAAHFYFVYVHPFCDGNGRTARILNASALYHGGYGKMKSIPLSSAINHQLSGYYSSLSDSEQPIRDAKAAWLDISPFVSYMLDAFERSVMDAALSEKPLSESESRLLERMNKTGKEAEITAKKAAMILKCSETTARKTLKALVQKEYLTVNMEGLPFIYRFK